MRLKLGAVVVCDGCSCRSEPYTQEIQIRPEVGVHFLPPDAPSGWFQDFDRYRKDPLMYYCAKCAKARADKARQTGECERQGGEHEHSNPERG